MFITKLCKLKMRTLLTSVQIHRRKCLGKKLIISIFFTQSYRLRPINCQRFRSKTITEQNYHEKWFKKH